MSRRDYLGIKQYSAGLHNVGSYQVSGRPWVTASVGLVNEDRLQFPSVTKSITIINTTPSVAFRVHFNSSSAGRVIDGDHYITLSTDAEAVSIELNVKCKEIYLSLDSGTGAYQVVASLTGIDESQMYALTGSGLTD